MTWLAMSVGPTSLLLPACQQNGGAPQEVLCSSPASDGLCLTPPPSPKVIIDLLYYISTALSPLPFMELQLMYRGVLWQAPIQVLISFNMPALRTRHSTINRGHIQDTSSLSPSNISRHHEFMNLTMALGAEVGEY